MIKGGKFSAYEGTRFVTILIVSKILYTSTPVVVKQAGTAAWYLTLISCLATLAFFMLVYQLMKRFPGKNIDDIFEIVLGRILGKIGIFLFSCYILFYAATSTREFMEMIKTYTLPDTQPSTILITFTLVIALLAYKGLETIVRISCIEFYPIFVGLFTILILAYQYYDIDYLKPYFGYGFKKSLYVGFLRSSAYEEVLILPFIATSMHNLKDFKKIGASSIVISGIIFSITLACYLMSHQYTMGIESLSGIFQLSRIIYFNRYFQRIEAIFIFIWVISALLTVATAFYTSIIAYCQCFEIKAHEPLVIPLGLLMYVITLIPKNVTELIGINLAFIRQYSLIFVYGVPVLVLLISIVLKKKEGDSSA